jgi:hypothetical protein
VIKQHYWCNRCDEYFVEYDGFQEMTYPKGIIVKTFYLFVEGLSLKKYKAISGNMKNTTSLILPSFPG